MRVLASAACAVVTDCGTVGSVGPRHERKALTHPTSELLGPTRLVTRRGLFALVGGYANQMYA